MLQFIVPHYILLYILLYILSLCDICYTIKLWCCDAFYCCL